VGDRKLGKVVEVSTGSVVLNDFERRGVRSLVGVESREEPRSTHALHEVGRFALSFQRTYLNSKLFISHRLNVLRDSLQSLILAELIRLEVNLIIIIILPYSHSIDENGDLNSWESREDRHVHASVFIA
jgi:hypothetical protein